MTAREAALQTAIADMTRSAADVVAPKRQRSNSRIMYIEHKGGELIGPARIGQVTSSRTGCTLYYRDQTFQSLKGQGYKANYFEVDTGDTYWIFNTPVITVAMAGSMVFCGSCQSLRHSRACGTEKIATHLDVFPSE